MHAIDALEIGMTGRGRRLDPVLRSRPADERRLYLAIRAILGEAIERRGSSIDDYTAPEGDGSMQERLDVYGRTGEPCGRCDACALRAKGFADVRA